MPNCYVGVPQGQYIKTYTETASDPSLLTNPQPITYLTTSEKITLTRSSITSTIYLTESISSSASTTYENSIYLFSYVEDSIWKFAKATRNSTTYSQGKITTLGTYNTTYFTNYICTISETMSMENNSDAYMSFFTSEDNKGYILFSNTSFSYVGGTERSCQTYTHTTTDPTYGYSYSEPYTFQSYYKSYGGALTNTSGVHSIVIYDTNLLFNDINNSSWGTIEKKTMTYSTSSSDTLYNNTLYGEITLTKEDVYKYTLNITRTSEYSNKYIQFYFSSYSIVYLQSTTEKWRMNYSALTINGYFSATPVNITGISYEYSPEASSMTRNANYLWQSVTSNYRGISTSTISIYNNIAKNIKKIYIGGN